MVHNRKINKMEEETFVQHFVIEKSNVETIRLLLKDGWIKKETNVFIRERENYKLIFEGKTHPIWKLKIKPKNEKFSNQDWKLKKDLNSITNLGQKKSNKLFLNDKNREEVAALIESMIENGFQLVYNNNYIIFRDKNRLNIFKIAAKLTLQAQPDGWYIGQKRIL
jgi:hypothetical protein